MKSPPYQAGVVVVTQFVDPQNAYAKRLQAFENYINYIDRDEAVRTREFSRYSLYNDYMNNPDKSNGLFTADKEYLTQEEKQTLKAAFQIAFLNQSVMWQSVVSFDNRFLTAMGIYDPATKTLNEKRLQESVRNMMRETLRREGMTDSAIWSAAIHYNTDNIHIHIAYTEPFPTRQKKIIDGVERARGYFSKKTIRAMKSQIVNSLCSYDRQLMDELSRGRILAGRKALSSFADLELRKMFVQIYRKLPKDKRLWHYNMTATADLRPLLDAMTWQYINTYHQADFSAYQKLLLKEQESMKQAYGANSHYRDYAKNKMDDLFARMGNAILAEMREYSRYEILMTKNHRYGKSGADYLNNSIRKLQQSLNATFSEKKENEYEHEQLMKEIEGVK